MLFPHAYKLEVSKELQQAGFGSQTCVYLGHGMPLVQLVRVIVHENIALANSLNDSSIRYSKRFVDP